MVKMDEEGLVASAVTAIGMVESAIGSDTNPILFKADHPFEMFIIDGEHNNTILFMGQINNPGIPSGSETPTYNETINPWNNFTYTFMMNTTTELPVTTITTITTEHDSVPSILCVNIMSIMFIIGVCLFY